MARAMLVRVAVPVFERVRVRLAEEPTASEPKLRVLGAIWRWDSAPMPVSWTVSGRVVREFERLRVPVRIPAAVGVKAIWAVQLVLGARVLVAVGQFPVTA
jgi:hypothetical protein